MGEAVVYDDEGQRIPRVQGSMLSVTLATLSSGYLKHNSIIKCLKPGIGCSVFVNSFHTLYLLQTQTFEDI